MKKKILRTLMIGMLLMLLNTISTLSAETNEEIYNVVIQENQGIPYVSSQILSTGGMRILYPNAVAGSNYAVAVLTEKAGLSSTNIVYLDQKTAQGNSVSFDIYSEKMDEGQYDIYISSDADRGITNKTQVASFSYGRPDSEGKKPGSIIVKTRPVKTVYAIGEQLDLRGLVITVIYDDNSTDEIAYDGTNMSFSGFDASGAVNQQRVTVVYKTMKAAFTVDIVPPDTEAPSETKVSLKKADISGIKSSYSYTKRNVCPVPTVRIGKKVLTKGIDYDISYENNKNAGTAFIVIMGKGNYTDIVIKKFRIKQIASKITVSKTKFKASDLKKNAQKFRIKIVGSSGKTAFKYPKKYISVSKKGVVTLKKRIPNGIYKIKVTVAAKKNYKKTVKTIKIMVL
ncbi:hypothetical protein D3Z36_07650 [Lachnospiraceae bacterium]|nr:hypothetical protein [Lachnospiraceae bacterium]